MKKGVVDAESPSMSDTPFHILDLPIAFDLNMDTLEEKYFQAQLRWHPDKFSAAPDMDKAMAESKSSEINAAYKILKDPLQRAKEILKIHNISVDTATPPLCVLEQSMDHRMRLEEISTSNEYDAFLSEIVQEQKTYTISFKTHLNTDMAHACDDLMHLIYLDKTYQALKKKKIGNS